MRQNQVDKLRKVSVEAYKSVVSYVLLAGSLWLFTYNETEASADNVAWPCVALLGFTALAKMALMTTTKAWDPDYAESSWKDFAREIVPNSIFGEGAPAAAFLATDVAAQWFTKAQYDYPDTATATESWQASAWRLTFNAAGCLFTNIVGAKLACMATNIQFEGWGIALEDALIATLCTLVYTAVDMYTHGNLARIAYDDAGADQWLLAKAMMLAYAVGEVLMVGVAAGKTVYRHCTYERGLRDTRGDNQSHHTVKQQRSLGEMLWFSVLYPCYIACRYGQAAQLQQNHNGAQARRLPGATVVPIDGAAPATPEQPAGPSSDSDVTPPDTYDNPRRGITAQPVHPAALGHGVGVLGATDNNGTLAQGPGAHRRRGSLIIQNHLAQSASARRALFADAQENQVATQADLATVTSSPAQRS